MIQQVNLYTEELRPRKEPVKAQTAVRALVAALLLIVAAAVVVRMEAADLTSRQIALQQEMVTLEKQVSTLTTQIEARRIDPALEKELEQVTTTLARRQRLLAEVEGLVSADTDGFSGYLAALARQIPEGLWLTGVRLDLIQDQVDLTGRTRAGSQVPVYLEKLSDEPMFEGRTFENFRLERGDGGRWVEFVVGTERQAGDGS